MPASVPDQPIVGTESARSPASARPSAGIFGPLTAVIASGRQLEKCGDVAGSFVSPHGKRRVDRGQQAHTVDTVGGFSDGRQPILQRPLGGVPGRLACHATVQHGAKGVDVRCRPLIAHGGGVLFERRVAGRNHSGEASGLCAHCPTGGAEIDQYWDAVGADHDVAGLDVPVQQAVGVDLGQTSRERQDMLANLRLGEGGLAPQHLRQRFAVDVLHHDIAGAVCLEKSLDAYNVGMIEARQRAGFIEKTFEPPLEIGLVLDRGNGHAVVGVAYCEAAGQEFLDCHAMVEVFIDSRVGDAEPARTEIPFDSVLAETITGRQGDEVLDIRSHDLVQYEAMRGTSPVSEFPQS